MEDIISQFELMVFWLPVFLLVLIWIFFTKQGKYREMKSQMDRLQSVKDLTLQQNKILDEQTKVFERIATALESQNKSNNSN